MSVVRVPAIAAQTRNDADGRIGAETQLPYQGNAAGVELRVGERARPLDAGDARESEYDSSKLRRVLIVRPRLTIRTRKISDCRHARLAQSRYAVTPTGASYR